MIDAKGKGFLFYASGQIPKPSLGLTIQPIPNAVVVIVIVGKVGRAVVITVITKTGALGLTLHPFAAGADDHINGLDTLDRVDQVVIVRVPLLGV